jgi:molybdenum cofactor cytidylyltransferase
MISSILLAAGQSKRMEGENKLCKEIKGIPLIQHSLKGILGSAIDEIIIVVGYEKEKIKKLIKPNKKIIFAYNKDFKNGIASSIKVGLHHISNSSEAFFISLADMPKINQNIYNKLIKTMRSYNKKLKPVYRKEIIIPTCESKYGNPILFSKFMKKKIMKIEGKIGAKNIIELNKSKVLCVPFKKNSIFIDFDTQENFNSL